MLLKLAEQLGLSPDVITLAITIGTLVVAIAHQRGNEMPILSGILRLLGAKLPAPPANPQPTPPQDAPNLLDRLREIIRDELRKLREGGGNG